MDLESIWMHFARAEFLAPAGLGFVLLTLLMLPLLYGTKRAHVSLGSIG